MRRSVPFLFQVCVASAVLCTAAPARQVTTRENLDPNGNQSGSPFPSTLPALSDDGRFVVFQSDCDDLVAGDSNRISDVFFRDRANGVTTRVDVSSAGAQSNRYSLHPAISGDGAVVAFESVATNLVKKDFNRRSDVFVHEVVTGVTTRVSVDSLGNEGNGDSSWPSLSRDGRFVAFVSNANNLVPGDNNGLEDVFVHDRATGVTVRVSVDSAGGEANGVSALPRITPDGSAVCFDSGADNLVAGDTNGTADVFLHVLATGATERVSVATGGVEANSSSSRGLPSDDGSRVAFVSWATNLVAGDTNTFPDVFLRDRVAGTTTRISVGATGSEPNGSSVAAALSADAHVLVFLTNAKNLGPADNDLRLDVYRRDLVSGAVERLTVDPAGGGADGDSVDLALSGDGQIAAFSSYATNLVSGDTDGQIDVFTRTTCPPAAWFNYGAGWPGALGVPALTASADPAFSATIQVALGNSALTNTFALLLVGLGEANLPTGKDGTLLVVPRLVVPLNLPFGGLVLSGTLPAADPALCGLEVDLQALEVDPFASKGLAFTDGLALVLGS